MLFHLFTVHGVPPPAHTKFPQCEECDYVALTASIMRKHLQKHQEGSENQCRVCGEPFTSKQVMCPQQKSLHLMIDITDSFLIDSATTFAFDGTFTRTQPQQPLPS